MTTTPKKALKARRKKAASLKDAGTGLNTHDVDDKGTQRKTHRRMATLGITGFGASAVDPRYNVATAIAASLRPDPNLPGLARTMADMSPEEIAEIATRYGCKAPKKKEE